jgi:hypothetical protein
MPKGKWNFRRFYCPQNQYCIARPKFVYIFPKDVAPNGAARHCAKCGILACTDACLEQHIQRDHVRNGVVVGEDRFGFDESVDNRVAVYHEESEKRARSNKV